MEEFLDAFRDEALEVLAGWEALCLKCAGGFDQAGVDALYRMAHNLKGGAAALDLHELKGFIHRVEDLIRSLQTNPAASRAEHSQFLLAAQGILVDWTKNLNNVGFKPAGADALLSSLDSLGAGRSGDPQPQHQPVVETAREVSGPSSSDSTPSPGSGTKSVRVPLQRIDRLNQLMGEVVIGHQMVCHLTGGGEEKIQQSLEQLTRLLKEVCFTLDTLQTVPVGQVFQRAVRAGLDAARAVGKQVNIDVEGDETLIDKSLSEKILDPLLHLVRNSIDHGLEPSGERGAKSPEGRVLLSAFTDLDTLVIRVTDDGRGLNYERIRSKAESLGWLQPGENVANSTLIEFLFRSGFSTAQKVTEISGRGVGLDVVRRSVEEMRGQLQVESETGKGSVWSLTFPLNVNLVQALLVATSENRFLLPVSSVEDILFPTDAPVVRVGQESFVRWRDKQLRSVDLSDLVNGPRGEGAARPRILVLRNGSERRALRVDAVQSRLDCVVRPLEGFLKNQDYLLGQTVLGDGSPCLILDPRHFFEEAS